ncbi:serine/threonine protein kinase [Pantanalinema sp. GBBB05]|uniref:serine/threonine protein kinase n=1 Tax=Pantanalinema sp. GBBB05 TaxID=2604139 RepID=UPI001DFABCA9|nr:serine/threonine protein kinase [Pantanalinema sp. GBBB05]
MPLTAGTPLQNGKYVIEQILGQSGLSMTLRVTQTRLNQPAIIKTLQPDLKLPIAITHLKQRFVEEAQRFAQCQHPGLVRIQDCFEEVNLPFVVMDYTPGHTLAEIVQVRGALPEELAIRVMRQVGAALTALHRQGLVHRHVTPHNIIHPPGSDVVVLVNLGLAHPSVLGVPDGIVLPPAGAYAAIEQYHAHSAMTAATDIYSLAATLYFLVTGQAPIGATDRKQTALVSPRQVQPAISAALEAAILNGMAMVASDRPQTIAAWLASLTGHEVLLPLIHATHNGQGAPTSTGVPAHPESSSPSMNSHLGHHRDAMNGSHPNSVHSSPTPLSSTVVNPSVNQPTAITDHPARGNPTRSSPSGRSSSRRFLSKVIAISAITASAGLGLGLVLRLAGAKTPGSTFFHTEQAFPSIGEWPLSATPVTEPIPTSLPEVPVRENWAPEPAVVEPATIPQESYQRSSPSTEPAPQVSPESSPQVGNSSSPDSPSESSAPPVTSTPPSNAAPVTEAPAAAPVAPVDAPAPAPAAEPVPATPATSDPGTGDAPASSQPGQ